MSPARIESLDRTRALVYLRRGENLLRAAKQALESGNADGAATFGVQCVVSFGDSFTVCHLQLMSKGQDHHEAIALIARVPSRVSREVAKRFQLVLNRKSEVEYGSRDVRMADAREIVSRASKLRELVGVAVRSALGE